MHTNSALQSARPPRIVRMPSEHHRVLIYTTCYNVLDGVTLTIRKLEQEILAAGHQLCILTTRSGDPRNTDLDGPCHPNRTVIFLDNSIPIPFLSTGSHSYHLGFGLSQAVQARLQAFGPTIVHMTAPDCTALHVIHYARTYGVPIMGTYHSNIPEYMEHYPGLSWLSHILRSFFRHQYNFLQALYVPTPFIVRHLQGPEYQMDQVTNLRVWGRGVDVDHFSPEHASLAFRRHWGIPEDAVVLLWVGRLVKEKRVDMFAKIVQELCDHHSHQNVHALVVGAGPALPDIEGLPNTTYTGWMGPEDLSVAYASSDIFLFPSSVETFGNVTLEAMASGLPVIVESGCSGHLVQHHCNGYACPAGDYQSFLQATIQLVSNAELRQRFSRTSRSMSLALEKRAVVRQMLQHYSSVTDDFYNTYGGCHHRRDQVLMQSRGDTFRGGNHPRPILLVLIEYLFITVFRVAWNMMAMVNYSQQILLVRRRRPAAATTSAAAVAARQKGLLLPDKTNNSGSPKVADVSTPQFKKQGGSGDEDHDDLSPEDSSALLSHTSSNTNNNDDLESVISSVSSDTLATTRMAYSESSSTSGNSAATRPTASFQCLRGGEHNAVGDCRLSHTMSKSFLRAVEFQCRWESKLRNSVCNRSNGINVAVRTSPTAASSGGNTRGYWRCFDNRCFFKKQGKGSVEYYQNDNDGDINSNDGDNSNYSGNIVSGLELDESPLLAANSTIQRQRRRPGAISIV